MIKEFWKDIPGYENIYQVSNLGNVRSLDRTINTKRGPKRYKSRTINPSITSSGYKEVRLHNSDGGKTLLLHRIVAETFLPNPENLTIVNHKDGNKINACLDNLEWVSRSDNNIHAHQKGLNPRIKIINNEQREEIRTLYSTEKISQSKLAQKFNVSQNTISKIIRGR